MLCWEGGGGGLGASCQHSYQRVPSEIRRAHQLHGVFTDSERARHVVRWENRGSCVCTCVHALIQFITNSTPVGRGLWARFLFSRTSSTLPHTSILQKNKCEFCSADIPSPPHVFEESKWPSGALLKPFLFAEVPQTSFFYDLQRPAAQPATVPVQSDEDTHRTCVCLPVCLSAVCMYVSLYVCT